MYNSAGVDNLFGSVAVFEHPGVFALVYGTHNLGDFAYKGWGSPSAALQAAMQEMFPARAPYLDEMF